MEKLRIIFIERKSGSLALSPEGYLPEISFFRREWYNDCVVTEKKPYLHIASARDFSGRDRVIYRFFEMVPGLLSWGTLIGVVLLSWLLPAWAAVFIIAFDLYWLIKTVFLSFYLRANHYRLKQNLQTDWGTLVKDFPQTNTMWQMVILPFYKEGSAVLHETLHALQTARWPKERMIIILAYEERAGSEAEELACSLVVEYKKAFGVCVAIRHPAGVPGELMGKGSNIAHAAREAVRTTIDPRGIQYEDVLVSAFDIDTHPGADYFLCLAYHFLTAQHPHRSSFQPVPVYNNNIWETSAFSRVVATSGTFWQMMQQERPERLTTFSSHSMSLQSLAEVGYWQNNIVSEDSRIFWNHFFYYNGDYRVVPLAYPVSLDANIGRSFWETVSQVYHQQRRWTWGVENVPYILFCFLKNKAIPFRTKVYYTAIQLEGFWGLATNPLLIFLLGWLPLMLGGTVFNATLLSYNLPRVTRTLMTVAMLGLIGSAIISLSLLPPRPHHFGARRSVGMILQWLLIPVTITVFGAIPGLEAQTRLLLGGRWRLGFWVTPKYRKQ